MSTKGKKKEYVFRNFEWRTTCPENTYVLSETFKLCLDEINTKWQLVLFAINSQIYANFHKVETSSDDFLVTVIFSYENTVKFDGHSFDKIWTKVGCNMTNFKIYLQRYRTVTSDAEPGTHLSNYEKLFNKEMLSDFKFICSDGQEIPAHRFVLVAHSPVMYKMLMTPMTESRTQTAKLGDIDSETMLEVLRFLYIRKVKNIEELAPSLLYCAEKYGLDDLKSFATQSMLNNLTLDNALEYFKLADRYNENALLQSCTYFISRNYPSLCDHEDWKKIDTKTKVLFDLLSIDDDYSGVSILKTLSNKSQALLPEEYKKFP